MAIDASIPELLRHAESKRKVAEGPDQPVALSAADRDVFVVSDLHLAEGVGPDGQNEGTENFFADGAFQRFLEHAHDHLPEGRKAVLMINGDFVDFMRIMHAPEHEEDFEAWAAILAQLGQPMTKEELAGSINDKERKHGLKTHDFKSVWKLARTVGGHAVLFDALACWVAREHHLVILEGNHDLEWHWPAVRNYLRLVLAQRIAAGTAMDPAEALKERVSPNVYFIDDAAVFDDELYIEHGHRYDRRNTVLGEKVLEDGEELNIPFGSFFSRYLINHVELVYPFFDNIRPLDSLLPLLVRERFFLALRLLFQHLPFALLVIPKRYYRYLLGRVLVLGLAVGVPVGILLWQIIPALPSLFSSGDGGGLGGFLREQAMQFGWLAVSYFLGRLVSYFQIAGPESLAPQAREQFAQRPCRFVTFGHTHDPEQVEADGKWYYNTGTWVPVVELSNAALRLDKTYTFLHLRRGEDGTLQPSVVERWDDQAGRVEAATLVKSKR